MLNRKQIIGAGLALSLLLTQTAYADYIPPLNLEETQEQQTQAQNQPGAPGQDQPGAPGQDQPGTQETRPEQPGVSTGLTSAGSYSTKEPVSTGGELGVAPQPGNTQTNAQTNTQPELPVVAAEGAILYDATNDRVLFEKNADKRFFPASITKLMTALLVLENADLNDTVTFSKTAVTNLESGAVTLKLAEGDRVSVKDCMYALLLKSANEVANGLAEHVAGSIPKFADQMNAKAKALGCTGTNFVNPNGLNDPNHYTTCRDMAKIAKAAFENKTLCEIDSTLSYNFPATKNVSQVRVLTPGHKMFYPNDFRYYAGIIGGKTGYTSLAGNTLVTCVEKDGVRMIAVVLKAKSTQYTDTKAMLDYGYELSKGQTSSGQAVNASYNRWIQNGDGWQFALADGTLMKNTCVTIDGEEYLFDSEGRMLTGWQYIGDSWYCLKESGAMAKNRWMQDRGKWFYLGSDGRMVTNAVIDGQYTVGADGIWIQ